MKIGILGIGGVGGFIGAKLAHAYQSDPTTEIIFICRGATKQEISAHGLCLRTNDQHILAKPSLASDEPEKIGYLDLLIIATKAFSLPSVISAFQDCISPDTVIIPLQNGIDAAETLLHQFPKNPPIILEGCIYIASNIEKPGVIHHLGGPGKVIYGKDGNGHFPWVTTILQKAGIDTNYTSDIKKILWKKFLFVSPLAAITTAYGVTFGEVAKRDELLKRLRKLMLEVQAVANTETIMLQESDIEEALNMLSNFPYSAKSSLQLDVEEEAPQTEKATFIDFVIAQGRKAHINTEAYLLMDKLISEKTC
ncbi:ketopantoate reductase family protein [Echinicola rosea]|uniref:2-dehydropantoate 2-reductase n=1 Tax=Echinicola rosea TaxID=1807691 RepID=A0ABQ1UQU5_9BACT|nr:2-dehydropantoate 2-reductase [Echinicola rosea]GGF22936.1 2-dehydropantoate 2-reductase [Echinicola rosea]